MLYNHLGGFWRYHTSKCGGTRHLRCCWASTTVLLDGEFISKMIISYYIKRCSPTQDTRHPQDYSIFFCKGSPISKASFPTVTGRDFASHIFSHLTIDVKWKSDRGYKPSIRGGIHPPHPRESFVGSWIPILSHRTSNTQK